MVSVLFVCIGNSCRSPMAEVLGRRRWEGLCEELTTASAGLAASPGAPASENAQRVAEEGGEDLHSHRTRRLNAHLVDGSDLILAMTRAQKAEILRWHPQARGKVLTLGEFAAVESSEEDAAAGGIDPEGMGGAGYAEEVEDPWGEDAASYRQIWSQIERLITAARPRLKEWLNERGLCP